MKTLHQNLEQRFTWYKKWHENRSHSVMHYVLLVLAILLTAAVVFSSDMVKAASTVYYVSPTGSDTNAGTQGSPWKTVAKACNTVTTAGDTIHITAGTYTESVPCNLVKGVNIEGEGKTNTFVKSTITGTWSIYMSLESPDGTNGNQTISGFTLNGQANTTGNASGTWMGIFITGRSNVSVHDMNFINFFQGGATFSGNHLDGQNATNWTAGPYATGNSFYNNDGANCAGIIPEAGMSGSGCLMIGWQEGMEIHHNSLITTARPVSKNGWPIKYWSNGFLKGVKIHHNTFIKSPFQGTSPWAPPDWDFAVEFFNVKGMEFNNNYVQGSVDINYVYKDTYAYGLWAHDNILDHAVPNYTHAESGFIFEFKAENIIVENNVINNVGVGISYNTRYPANTGGYNYACGTGGCSAILNNIIRNNLFTNIYSMGGASGGIVVQTENGTNNPYMDNLQIYNNTFVARAGQPSPDGIDFTQQNNGGVAKNIFIRNNIFQGFSNGSITANTATTQSNVLVTHNDYYNTPAPVWSGGGVTMNNNLNVVPGFISTTNFNLQTSPLSGLIDKGINVGLPFNGAAPDMGAYETGSSAPDTTPPSVVSTNPANTSTGVATTISPSFTLSEALAVSTVTSASAYVRQGATTIPATVTYSNNSIVIDPTASLVANTAYSAVLTTAITDVAGNSLPGTYTINFTTAPLANVPPTVSAGADQTITLPTTSVTMAGTATDSDGTIATRTWSKVSGPTAFTITSPTSLTTTITGLINGTYVFRLTVVDNSGASVSDDVSIIVRDTTAPKVSITAPAAGTVSASIALSATASDNIAVDHVDFHIDGNYTTTVGTDATSPYSVTWNTTTVPNGAHTLTARAYDTSGNFTTSSSVAVTVSNTIGGGADTIPPTVSITSPTAGATVTGSVIITSSAGDASGVAQVKFYRGTTLIGSDTCGTGPTCNATGTYNFAVTWNTAGLSGAQSLTAVAYDRSGNVTTSAAVSVTVGTVVTNGAYTNWNPSDKSSRVTLSNNNLTAARNGGVGIVRAAAGKSSGKWYWEVKLDTAADQFVGVANSTASLTSVLGSNRNGWSMVMDDGVKFNRGNQGYYGTKGSNGDVIGIALDMDSKKISFYKKKSGSTACTNIGTAFTNLSGTLYPAWGSQFQAAQGTVNFGATPFACPVPSGFTAGVTQ